MSTRPLRVLLAAVGLVALTACSDDARSLLEIDTAPDLARGEAPGSASGRFVPNSYIVVLKEGANPRAIAAISGVTPKFVYLHALTGFAAKLGPAQVKALSKHPHVETIEPDPVIALESTTQKMDSYGDPWGLDRIDQRYLSLSKTYKYVTTASRVNAYIIDTGVQTSHPEFGGRARSVFDAWGGNGQDCNGHGTHVAGTVGATTFGVAKRARLHSLKVMDCRGAGSGSGLLAAIDWVRKNHSKPAVVNMSVSASRNSTINDAVTRLVNAGVFVSVAAGNSNADACNFSPASAAGVYTVAASTKNDERASYSNYGSCVTGYAPGSSIRSAYIGSTARNMSGTSMAAPHVAGVAALYLSGNLSASPSTVHRWIRDNSTSGVVKNNRSGTANRLLFKSSL